jgi:hypothetical protein
MEGFVVLLVLLVVIPWWIIGRRLSGLAKKVDDLSSRAPARPAPSEIERLEIRVALLEQLVHRQGGHAISGVPIASPQERPTVALLPTVPPTTVTPPLPGVEVESTPPATPVEPVWSRRAHEWLRGEEWETVIGGSWLNKVGVLVLVIGLTLFLGYSLTHLGPTGKIAVGLLLGVAMVAGGVCLERRRGYAIFGHGLIGGGWAALYVTAYAMHGFDATRILPDPVAATTVLIVVAGGLVLHSLRYRSETVTGLAYAAAFVTIAISPAASFALLASLLLTASLLLVGYLHRWNGLPTIGCVATYAIYALCYAPTDAGRATGLLAGQATLALYWLLFEVFDIVAAGPARRGTLRAVLLPLNAVGFILCSLLQWSMQAPDRLGELLAAAAGVYLVSAVVRARSGADIRAATEASGDRDVALVLAHRHEVCVLVATVLWAWASYLRLQGMALSWGWLLEAEMLFLVGLRLDRPFLRLLAAAVFVLPIVKLWATDVPTGGELLLAGCALKPWTPVALGIAAALYLDRALSRTARIWPPLGIERAYGYMATSLVILVIGFEVPGRYVGTAWLAVALPFFELGLRRQCTEVRYQGIGLASLGVMALIVTKVFGVGANAAGDPWLSLGPAAVVAYVIAARFHRLPLDWLPTWERVGIRDAASAAGAGLLALLSWHVLAAPLVALAWGAMGLVLIELGSSRSLPFLRVHGHVLAAATFVRLFLANFTGLGETVGVSHRLLTVVPSIILFAHLRLRLQAEGAQEPRPRVERMAYRAYLYVPAILAVVLARFEAGRVLAVVAWALLMLALLIAGRRWALADLRWQGYVLALLTATRCWGTNFYIPESLGGLTTRLTTGGIVIAAFVAAWLISSRRPAMPPVAVGRLSASLQYVDAHARSFFIVLAALLLAVLLLHEVSGAVLTVAWALEGMVLALVGFLSSERSARLSGLALLGVCLLKALLYDMREFDTPARIVSFIGLGLLMLGVSFLYTRYRDNLRHYL